ncbi:MAG TPA: FecR domain-containing protein [Pyrinomonadaceae bacterium]|nr:FecR domain-containing protein [Pyrinomonadaceae bacterium]
MKSNRDEELLDKITAEIRNQKVDESTVSAAADRVWARVSAAAGETEVQVPAIEHIEGCRDFQSLIPAYLAGRLSEARSLLLVDHTHECIPCRKAMNEARRPTVRKATAQPSRFAVPPAVMRWAVAAAIVIGIGLLAIPFAQRFWPFGEFEATVQAAEGQVFQIDDTQTASVAAGAKLQKGEKVRTAKDARAVVQLGDGSTIEMRDRSELYLTKNGQGTTIHLSRGSIVVEAAKQRDGKLFVESGDSLVSVTGTVFSVNNGTKGSRVSVIEGEVNLSHAGSDHMLRAGEQATTNPAISMIPVKDEVAWSRNATRYAEVLSALASVNADLRNVDQPGARYSTHLLDLMPENTVVYAALPNLAESIAESHRIIQERMSHNEALRQWWEKEQAGKRQNMDEVVQTIRQFGSYLGDEIAVSVPMNAKTEPGEPLVLAELKNSAGLRELIEQQITKYSGDQNATARLSFVEDPKSFVPTWGEGEDRLYIWIQDNLFAASPKLESLQSLQTVIAGGSKSSFTTTPFRDRIAQVYQEGAGLLVAANLENILERSKAERTKAPDGQKNENALQQLGVLSVKYFVFDQKDTNGKTNTQASISFSDTQRGIPAWLAAPGPMGSLEYISPDANVVAGFVVKNPVSMVDDLLGVLETVSPDLRKTLDQQQAARGVDIRNDIAAPLGGEFAFAIDGPILPTPSWKLVFEVNDPTHLQQALEHVVSEANKEVAKFGRKGLTMEQTDLGGRKYYTLKSSDFGLVEVNYTYANGYLIVGPSRALVERALTIQESGFSLLRSAKFTAGLPADGNANFSAVFYHNIAGLVPAGLASTAEKLPSGPQEAMKAIAGNMPPTLAYAYAQGDSITFNANTDGGPFGLGPATILGMPNALEMQNIIQRGMGGKH